MATNINIQKAVASFAFACFQEKLSETMKPIIEGAKTDRLFQTFCPAVLEQLEEGLVTETEAMNKLIDEWSLSLQAEGKKSLTLAGVIQAYTDTLVSFLTSNRAHYPIVKALFEVEFPDDKGFNATYHRERVKEWVSKDPFVVLGKIQDAMLAIRDADHPINQRLPPGSEKWHSPCGSETCATCNGPEKALAALEQRK